ncbi:unnamed protein product [Prunus armeniaca]|uniref:Leucine-rich repeat-containing N-terminal plant-type domain-containing protein n=1 Tax=Prunus armeniaca TaxID=36596 RepID=A0A6J5XNK1_PRUAR|nr:unnamed protein product [Prunus armeniaca]
MKTLLHYLFLLCFNILLPAVHSQCIKDQQQSLLHLKKSLQFDQPSRQTPLISWNSSTDCCSWVGVTCTSDGHVVGLDLSNKTISGPILGSFANFSNLRVLNLSSNTISGTVPGFFANFSKLTSLNLSGCWLNGIFPNEIFQVPTLQTIDLSANFKLGGSLPEFPKKIGSLQSLSLSETNFSGSLPDSIGNLKMLSTIDLSNCSFHGSIPSSLFSLPLLSQLNLSHNQFSGELAFSNVSSNLVTLDLSFNNLEGQISVSIFNSTVKTVDLHSNKLQGPIPTFLPSAKYLDYSINNFSSIPSNIGDFLTNTLFFSLSSNNLHGLIPASICNASNLQILNLSNNSLSGMIPQCLTAMRHLSVLNLARNNLTGSISNVEVTEDSSLQILEIGGNQLYGKVPKSLAKCTMLEVLNIGNNNITDSFPCLLKNISTLRVLILRSNNFYGGIECLNTNGTWPGVQIIDLAHNNFSGEIQGILWRTWREMMATENGSLSTIAFGSHTKRKTLASMTATSCTRVSDKSCRGYKNVVPSRAHESCLSDPTNRLCNRYADAGSSNADAGTSNADDGYSLEYSVSVTVTSKGLEMELVKILSIFTLIDFSSNNFSGPIPTEIGEFKALCVLNLSRNAFTGEIPSKFGNMQVLESLDLSQNKLSGHIPPQLAELTFLSFLDLSYNQLVGRIPTSNQFSTFPPSSFTGNKGLRGFPLTVDNKAGFPPPPTMNGRSPNSGHHHEVNWDLISAEIGFIVGFGVAVGSLVSCKRWRKWYYRAMYNILLKIFPQLEERIGIHRKHVHINQW